MQKVNRESLDRAVERFSQVLYSYFLRNLTKNDNAVYPGLSSNDIDFEAVITALQKIGGTVPTPHPSEHTLFLCSDGRWREADPERYYLTSSGSWTLANFNDFFLKGDGTWAKIDIPVVEDVVDPKAVYVYLYNGNTLHFSNVPIKDHSPNILTEEYYLEAQSDIQNAERVPWVHQKQNITKVTSELNLIPTRGIGYWFYDCSNLTDISQLYKWNVSGLISMYNTFGFDAKITDWSGLRRWNTRRVTNMVGTFRGCTGLSTLAYFETWDVSKVKGMTWLFSRTNISDLSPIANWNISSVYNLGNMFSDCVKITTLDPLINWSPTPGAMSEMFNGCAGLRSIAGLRNFKVHNVETFNGLFRNCINLQSVAGIANWDTKSIDYIGYMFYNCSKVDTFEVLNNWTIKNNEHHQNTFYGTTGKLPSWAQDW